ncbi:MAG: VanZ family protein [Burkholderiales bacterium]|nr:MAG: VanZ family protein [Burkholderiales bacterium]
MKRAVFWISLVLVTVLSLLPGEQLPPQAVQVWDKAQHALGFFWLGLWGLAAHPRHVLRVIAGLLLAGVAIEVAQSLTTWRQGDVWDWVADAVGLGTAALGWLVWSQRRRAPSD